MYKYYSEVRDLIEEMISTYNIRDRSIIFYEKRINKFFLEYMDMPDNLDKPLNALTYFDINLFLNSLSCSEAEKVNYYSALKRFFEFTYLKGKTNEVIRQVTKPIYQRKPKEKLNDEEYFKLVGFIVDRENPIIERLILGLFVFTGLSRKYIASLRNNQFLYDDGVFKLSIWEDEQEIKLPLKSELQLIINEYKNSLGNDDALKKVVPMSENALSTFIANLTHSIIGKRCTPTLLSNTFISKALLNGNYIWEVSKLTLESVSTIEMHVKDHENLFYRQTSILNSF